MSPSPADASGKAPCDRYLPAADGNRLYICPSGSRASDPAGYDLYAASAAFRRAVCEALPDGVTPAGRHFFGPYAEQDCEWDSPLDIRAIIDSVSLEPIIKAHQIGGRTS